MNSQVQDMDHTITLGSYILHWIFQTSHRDSVGQTITINPCVSISIADCSIGHLILGLWQDGQVQGSYQTITLGTCIWYGICSSFGLLINLTINPLIFRTCAEGQIGHLILSFWQDGQVEDMDHTVTLNTSKWHAYGI